LANSISALWNQALEEPFALIVETDDPEELERQLLEVRLSEREVEWFNFYLVKKPGEVWIVRARNVPKPRTDGEYASVDE